MSSIIREILLTILKFSISVVSALTLSYIIYLIPIMRYFSEYLITFIIGLPINPLISSFIFFTIIFIIYTAIFRTSRLGPLVNIVLSLITLVLNSPTTYFILSYLGSRYSSSIVNSIVMIVRYFHVSYNIMVIICVISIINVVLLIICRVLENYEVINELISIKRVDVRGSIHGVVLYAVLILILSLLASIGIFVLVLARGSYFPLGISILGICAIVLMMLLLISLRRS